VDILNPITALLRVCSFPSLFLFSQLTLSLIHHYQLAWLPTFFFRERYSLLLDGIIWTIILFSSSWPVRSFFFYQPSDLFLDSPFAFLIPFLDDLVTLPLQPRRAPSLLRSLPKRDDFDSSAASPACSSYEHRLLLRPSILGTHRLVEQLNHSVQFLVGTEARTTDTWKLGHNVSGYADDGAPRPIHPEVGRHGSPRLWHLEEQEDCFDRRWASMERG
jgi:hypothetical protein